MRKSDIVLLALIISGNIDIDVISIEYKLKYYILKYKVSDEIYSFTISRANGSINFNLYNETLEKNIIQFGHEKAIDFIKEKYDIKNIIKIGFID
jgi:hypothetical protein